MICRKKKIDLQAPTTAMKRALGNIVQAIKRIVWLDLCPHTLNTRPLRWKRAKPCGHSFISLQRRPFRGQESPVLRVVNLRIGRVWNATDFARYSDVIMSAMVSQITSASSVCLTVRSGGDQRKIQSTASLASVREIHRWPVDSPHKGPVTRKCFPFDDVIISL